MTLIPGRATERQLTPPSLSSHPLNDPRRERFCLELLIDDNQTQAAIRAGYSKRAAHVTASRLLKDAKVAARITYLRAARNQRVSDDGDAVLRAARASALFDLRKAASWGGGAGFVLKPSEELDDQTAAGIHGIEETVTELRRPDGTVEIRRKSKLLTDKTRNREIVLRAEEAIPATGQGGPLINIQLLIGPGVQLPKQDGVGRLMPGGVMVLTKEAEAIES